MFVFLKIWKIRFLPQLAGLIFFYCSPDAKAQQILWAKVYALPEEDQVFCIVQDVWGDMYVGGNTRKGAFFPGYRPLAMIYKLNPEGDTIFSKWTGLYGSVQAIQESLEGNILAFVEKRGFMTADPYQTHLLTMTPDGIIFRRDTIPNILFANHSCIGKDSSWIICGYKPNDFNGFIDDFYIQRIRKDGTVEPFLSLNDSFSGRAHRVEQLPNGKYLVSGSAGKKIISYILNEDLSNPQPFETWYQATGISPMSSGHVGQSIQKRMFIGGYGSPSVVGLFDSLQNKLWLKLDTGVQVSPQAMVDGSILVGYSYNPTPPAKYFQRLGADSTTIWKISFGDSLIARGYPGSVNINAFTSFPDESAVLAGYYRWDGAGTTNTKEDPIFLRIANVGTPVTSLSKPKPGPLKNETLAPWPNPTGGTLYLKQHFDKADIRLYNLAGKEVGQYQIRFGQPIEISHLQSGIYLYRAVIDGKSYSGKVIKN